MKNTQELLNFVEHFASGRWAELPDGTIEVGGSFYCYDSQLTSLPESIGNMKIGGDFYCANNQLTSLPESIGNMKIGGSFYCYDNQLTSLPESIGNMKIGGGFYCSYNQLTSLPESIGNMKVGGNFYCANNQLTSLPESIGNMKIGGGFYCSYNQLTSLPESIGNMKVGDGFYCYNNQLISPNPPPAKFTSFEVGNDYIYADGILWELESRRSKSGITIYKCVFGYVVSDGDTHSHGKTLRQAVSDLQFKKAKRNPDEYKDLDIDAVRSVEEVTLIYRVITGACSTGCKIFTAQHWTKKTITLRKALELTTDVYGGKQFAAFYGWPEVTK